MPVINVFGVNKTPPLGRCEFGIANPIYPLTGVKKEYISTGIGVGGLNLSLVYDTTLKIPANQADTASALVELSSFGALWKSSFHHRLLIATGATRALLSRGDGKVFNFIGNGAGVYTTDADNTHKLVSIAGGYRFTDVATGDQETYDSTGILQSLTRANGMVLSFSYTGKNLTRVQASDGRILRFSYTNNLITQIITPDGRTIVPAYDANRNLVSLTWQDGKVSQFLYENAAFPWALTGKIDENNARYATFIYDTQGRATTSEHAGGVERYSVSYIQAPTLVVTDAFNTATGVLSRQHSWQMPSGTTLELPNGQSSTVAAASVMGLPSVTSKSQPAGSGCAAATSTLSYDANGNIASEDDFNGQRSCFTNDLTRNLPTVAVEGLANTASCAAVLASNASLPTGSRKVSRQWHPDWSLTTKIAQPLKIITSIYNGQPDPFNSNAVASCAPVTATTPDGKPIAVLCKQVEQATTDADGSLGLAATPNVGVTQRVSTYTYDAFGRLLTSTDPMSRVTTYVYYGNSTDFTDPLISSDPNFESVVLLLHGDGINNSTVITDSSPVVKPVTVGGNAKVSTVQGKFGGTSMAFDGAGDYLSSANHDNFNLTSADFTIEAWVYVTALTAGTQAVVDKDGVSGTSYSQYQVGISPAGKMTAFLGNGNGVSPTGTVYTGTTTITLNAWHHIALVKSGSIFKGFLDGAQEWSAAAAPMYSGGKALLVGYLASGAAAQTFNGYIDDVRITKGVARYSANFTPPTTAFPNAGPVVDPNAVGHTVGDLQSITNAGGHVTQFTQYDRAGRLRQMVNSKGVVTDTAYTPRGWISSVTVTPPGGTARVTNYTYDNAGQLTGVTLPDATVMSYSYSYDAAHRLTGVNDAKGNSVTYSLDNMGNRTGEQVKDPSGNLQRNIIRVYDALNRVQQVTGASN
ncbi:MULTISPECIES: LamG-like jellyroll fold domain-containing protein [unclassified Polaromonas]|uniref:LamG-like jellyroll fold domain-containing protein n=1 Tax=unclassified Polaromonas TaxID=2638319 RepID=UPI0013DE4228|nr:MULTISPECIES: LamG-like jellyroll fold domain-containing protein [unclassified Polaromonas]